MALPNLVADDIVLESEKSVQHLDTQPPIVAETSLRRSILGAWYEAALFAHFVHEQLAMRVATSQTAGDSFAGAVYLRSVPPAEWKAQVSKISSTLSWAVCFDLVPRSVHITIARAGFI
jgi:hypothetical protein